MRQQWNKMSGAKLKTEASALGSAVQPQPGNVAYNFLEQEHVTGVKGGKLVQVTITFDVNPDWPIECRKIFFSQSKSIAIQKQSDRKIC